MNITDVGHLTEDNDQGEDKLEKGARTQKKSVWEVAKFFTDNFFFTMDQLNIIRPEIICRATDHIQSMIQLIKKLNQNNYIYETKEAIYFNTSRFPNYGKLNPQKKQDKIVGARKEVYFDPKKKHPADFVLWFKRIGRFKNHTMYWNSPWGDGFPGWHIECSAMGMQYLGETIDIHAGGIDHIAVHHENEISQSEAVTGKKFVRYWFHNEHLMVDDKKMSKSFKNFYTLDDIKQRGLEPLAIRYLFLQTHYRQPMNFTWKSAQAAQEGYKNLKQTLLILKQQTQRQTLSEEKMAKIDQYRKMFVEAITNDIQIPQALSVLWEVAKSNIPSRDKYDLIIEFDQVFGLELSEIKEYVIPEKILQLAEERKLARQKNNFDKADQLRKEIGKLGYRIEDTSEGFKIHPI
jgi:cysteinyl-tRNA synthetase